MTPFSVLMVCTANYCRSPIAEQLLTAAADARCGTGSWAVSSAGTAAYSVRPIHEFSAQVLTDRGVYTPGHRSRLLDAAMLRSTDLVLTATREHRSAVVRLLPAAIGRTFTMLQFARLAALVPPLHGDDGAELGRRLVVEAKAARPLLQPVPPEEDDLPDPMGRPLAEFERCAARLDAVVQAVLSPLRLETVTGPTP
jgi:protein-tyrosine phosphatase